MCDGLAEESLEAEWPLDLEEGVDDAEAATELDDIDIARDQQMEVELEDLEDVLDALPPLPGHAQCEAMFILKKVGQTLL